MIIVVSGEGPTDIGGCANGAASCEGADYVIAAMGRFIDCLVTPIWEYSPLDAGAMLCLTEGELGKQSRRARIVTLPGKNKERETGLFFKNAYALAKFCQRVENDKGCETMAVLFRDADGTRSTQNGLCEEKRKSMTRGFAAAGYDHGVPMVPKPKSEAWLLCAVQKVAYHSCARFEMISGNDHSPNSAKRQIEAALAERGKTYADASHMVADGSISPKDIDMPSFSVFRERLEGVARAMIDR